MRRIVTWLVAGAVGALGLAAGLDALRGDGDPPVEVAATTTAAAGRDGAEAGPVDELRAAGVAGVLTYADEDCRLLSVTLPDLEPHPAAPQTACAFRLSAGGEAFAGEGAPAPGLDLVATCSRGRVEARFAPGRGDDTVFARARGCAPAWRPDGTPTFARRGEVFAFEPCAGAEGALPVRCARRLLSRREIAGAFRYDQNIPSDPQSVASVRVLELEWLTSTRLVAILGVQVRHGPYEQLVAFFEGGKAIGGQAGLGSGFSRLRASPSRRQLAVAGSGGLRILDRNGETLSLPVSLFDVFGRPRIEPRAVAWSQDEAWLALATRNSIYVIAAGDPDAAVIRIPLGARDLVWR